jgi:hypothetical protein
LRKGGKLYLINLVKIGGKYMNLADRKELLLTKKAAHASKQEESKKLQEKIKSSELDDATVLKLQR